MSSYIGYGIVLENKTALAEKIFNTLSKEEKIYAILDWGIYGNKNITDEYDIRRYKEVESTYETVEVHKIEEEFRELISEYVAERYPLIEISCGEPEELMAFVAPGTAKSVGRDNHGNLELNLPQVKSIGQLEEFAKFAGIETSAQWIYWNFFA